MKAHCISASSLLHDKWRRKLKDEKLLRPVANGRDILWQQMTNENFKLFTDSKSLYFKAYGEYNDYDEMKLRNFIKPHVDSMENLRRKPSVAELQKAYDEFEEKLFISCWFNSLDLADVVFKVYAQNSTGVAIGTTVDVLSEQLSQAGEEYNRKENVNKINKIVCGNIQYVPQYMLREKELFEPAQVYAPVFTKGSQFRMDHEFRVCLEMNEAESISYNSEKNKRRLGKLLSENADKLRRIADYKGNPIEVLSSGEKKIMEQNGKFPKPTSLSLKVNANKLVQYIAIKDAGVFHELGRKGSMEYFESAYRVSMYFKQNKNGFMLFRLNRIGSDC